MREPTPSVSDLSGPLPTLLAVRAAADRIARVARRTPLRRSAALGRLAGGDVWLKLEAEQTTGSFKLRGAYNAIASLDDAGRARGVVTASAGNHGLGLAYASRLLGVRATVFVPRTAPAVKREKILSQGARLDDSAPHYDAAEALAKEHARATGALYVSPCSGDALLAGQGTVALEVLAELGAPATIVVGVGGGGLVGGVAAVVRALSPATRVVGAQSVRTAALARSLAAGRVVEIADEPTVADGLAGQVDDVALAIGRAALDDIATVDEAAIERAIAALWIEEGVRAEGAAATPVALVREALAGRATLRDALATPLVIIVSGGNIDPERHAEIVRRHHPAEG